YFLAQPVAKAWMFTATAVGMCVGPIPLHWAHKFDTRVIILIYGLVSAVATAFYPLFDSMGQWPSLASRFLVLGPLFTKILGGEMCTSSLGWEIINGRKVLNDIGEVPYRALFTDVSIWTSLGMFVAYYIGMIIYQLYSPTFIKQITGSA
ncbi:hypothetical protein TELCIR_17166, partial [Teladorsagia circumcincta]